MPRLIEHIDAIARQKNRDVLSIRFHQGALSYRYEDDPERRRVIAWLDA